MKKRPWSGFTCSSQTVCQQVACEGLADADAMLCLGLPRMSHNMLQSSAPGTNQPERYAVAIWILLVLALHLLPVAASQV